MAVHRSLSLANDLEQPDRDVLVLEDQVLVPPGLLDDHVLVGRALHGAPGGHIGLSAVLLVGGFSRDCVNHGQLSQGRDDRLHEFAIVLVVRGGDQIAVDDEILLQVLGPRVLQIVRDRHVSGDFASLDHAGGNENPRPVADRGDQFAGLGHLADEPQHLGPDAEPVRRLESAGQDDAVEIRRLEVVRGHRRPGRDAVLADHVLPARRGHVQVKAFFQHPVVRVHEFLVLEVLRHDDDDSFHACLLRLDSCSMARGSSCRLATRTTPASLQSITPDSRAIKSMPASTAA